MSDPAWNRAGRTQKAAMERLALPAEPRILTTTVGSYPIPDWLTALPSEQALVDATRVVFDIQRQAGIDLPTDGELYRFDRNHLDTNGMIEHFTSRMSGINTAIGRSASDAFRKKAEMGFRARPAGIVEGPLSEGSLNLLEDCRRAASLACGPWKFTVTSPYMLARTLLDFYYGDLETLTMAVADVMSAQLTDLPCTCVQIDEANIPGAPQDTGLCTRAINRLLDNFAGEKAVHLCFGNYGGQTIQQGTWQPLVSFLDDLHVDHLVLEMAHRPQSDLDAIAGIRSDIAIGVGVVDIKVNHIETADEIARHIERAEQRLGPGRVRFVHPDCGFWMLKRSIADRKIAALVQGRDRYLGL